MISLRQVCSQNNLDPKIATKKICNREKKIVGGVMHITKKGLEALERTYKIGQYAEKPKNSRRKKIDTKPLV